MRMHSLIALLVVSGIVTLNSLSNVPASNGVPNHQEKQTIKASLPKLGTERPALSFQLLSGKQAPTWPALEGRVVIVDFWATWCAPCIASIPGLNNLHARFEHEKVSFFSVTYEPPPYVREFLKEHPIASEVGIDDSFDTFKTFQAWGIPVIFIFDSKGKLVATTHPNNLTPEVISAALRGEVPQVKQAVPWSDPGGAENYFRKLQLELKEKYKQ
ncbi:MAG TPA: TlpA disulfide reductase family protein [Pyrinomonadaceae bacterium]|nr:TlpA disulfide reductase family protein [Pyrinomonadaceae bacterium]